MSRLWGLRMGNARAAVLAVGAAAGVFFLIRANRGAAQGERIIYVNQPVTAGSGGDGMGKFQKAVTLIGGVLDVFGGKGGAAAGGGQVGPVWVADALPDMPVTGVGGGGGGLWPLLNLIGKAEAPRGYDQYYGGIKSQHAPPRPLTQLTVNEVLAWQDSIDRYYNSEAAGRYQVMEDTLRGLVRAGQVSGSARFDAGT